MLAGDATEFFHVDPLEAAMAVGGAAHASFTGHAKAGAKGGADASSGVMKPGETYPLTPVEPAAKSAQEAAAKPHEEVHDPSSGKKAAGAKELSPASREEIQRSARKRQIAPAELLTQVEHLREKARHAENLKRPRDPKTEDAQLHTDGHDFDRNKSDRTWCRHSDPACGLKLGKELNEEVDVLTEMQEEAQAAAQREAKQKAKREAIVAADAKKTEADRAKQSQPKKLAQPKQPAEPPTKEQFKEEQAKRRDQQKEHLDSKSARQRDEQVGLLSDLQRVEDRLKEPLSRVDRKALEARKTDLGRKIVTINAERAKLDQALLDLEITPYQRARAYSFSDAAAKEVVLRARGRDEMSGNPIREPSIDHVVAIDRIVRMDGWESLTPIEQRAVLSDVRNLRFMEKGANASKGLKRWSDWKEGRAIYGGEVWTEMVTLESQMTREIQNKIIDTLADRGQRPPRPDRYTKQ